MSFLYLDLPFQTSALEPFISDRTMTVHHGKHYQKYVRTLNELTANSKMSDETLEEIIIKGDLVGKAIAQNAGQVWNHEFFWKCLLPEGPKPSKLPLEFLDEQFGSAQEFEDDFTKAALTLFGSGWVWVVRDTNGALKIEALENAGNPLTHGQVPLLVCDVWEHAYYLDYQSERGKYISQFWSVLNWKFFEENIRASESLQNRANQRMRYENQMGL